MKSPLSAAAPLAAAVLAAACAVGPALAAGESGMVVAIDAETGQLRAPTADEMKALQAAGKTSGRSTGRTAAARVEVTHANGAVELELGEEAMMYSVARVNAQGKVERACVQGLGNSQQAMKTPASFASRPQASRMAHATPAARLAKEPLDVK
jgi:hypothetical protein